MYILGLNEFHWWTINLPTVDGQNIYLFSLGFDAVYLADMGEAGEEMGLKLDDLED